jgi:AcrR family transcriptional regulator
MPLSLSSEQVAKPARASAWPPAEQQFAERGIEQTSMRSIAQALGWTATALYRYYDSKEALLAATRAAALDRLSAALEAAQQGQAMCGTARARWARPMWTSPSPSRPPTG